MTGASETQKLGEQFAQSLQEGTILLLYGDLGSGKTTFVQGLAKGLGIKSRIISPTFIIAREYEVRGKGKALRVKKFYHLDLYRTQTEGDLKGVGLEEIMSDPEAIVAIEWSEKLGLLVPEKRVEIHFKHLREDKRQITVKNF